MPKSKASELPLDPDRLEAFQDLRRRFADASQRYFCVDAVVVYHPDQRRREARDQALRLGADPETGIVLGEEWCESIPVFGSYGGRQTDIHPREVYWRDQITEGPTEPDGFIETTWKFRLVGPVGKAPEDDPTPHFEMLAHEAAHLVLGGHGKGRNSPTGWLIHLADREIPLIDDANRQVMKWPDKGHPLSIAPQWEWVYRESSSGWWAARLPNVFHLSRLAIEEVIVAAGVAPIPPVAERGSRSAGTDDKQQGPTGPPNWILDNFRRQQRVLLLGLWARGEVPADELTKLLGYTGPEALDNLRRRVDATNGGLDEKVKEIGGLWEIRHRDREETRHYFLSPVKPEPAENGQ